MVVIFPNKAPTLSIAIMKSMAQCLSSAMPFRLPLFVEGQVLLLLGGQKK